MKTLTVDELIATLTTVSKAGNGNTPVAILYDVGKATIGALPSVGIECVNLGFDLNAGKVFLRTNQTLGLSDGRLMELGHQNDALNAQLYLLKKRLVAANTVTDPRTLAQDSSPELTSNERWSLRHQVVKGMCMTMRHDYGLEKAAPLADGLQPCGMTGSERMALWQQMLQLYEHHIEPFVATIEALRTSPEGSEAALVQLLAIAHSAIEFRDASKITSARGDSAEFWASADAADMDEMDLEESLARLKLFHIIDKDEAPLTDTALISP